MRAIGIVLLTLTPGCAALDRALGVTDTSSGGDTSEATIGATETAISSVGNMLVPGAGGAAAVLFGVFARAYVKKRKATRAQQEGLVEA